MHSAASEQETNTRLIRDGLKELEVLLRSVLSYRSEPLVIADDDGHCVNASCGAVQSLGVSPRNIIGRKIEAFVDPAKVPYTKSDVSPGRHLLRLHDKSDADYALLLLDADGRIAAWYPGAERVYGHKNEEIVGQLVNCLNVEDDPLAIDEHMLYEGWHKRQDGSRFWANVLTTTVRDENLARLGYARLVRDFSERHRADEALRDKRSTIRHLATESTIAGVASGVYDAIVEANGAFLEMIGYNREDLGATGLPWAEIIAPECLALQEHAHEESLLHGACTPFEMEYIRKDQTRVRVLVASAILARSPLQWIAIVQNLTERDRAERIADQPVSSTEFHEIVGASAALKRVMGQVEIVAPTDATVLVLGETGTGKELVARAIHKTSGRRARPFITLNCAAIPTGLLESELFGYEKGAFTGALSQKIGRFERAHQGTLFLDEVGDIPLELQPKLLRALQEKEFERLGGTRTIPIDVRLLAATNRNLTQMMGDKLFRSDLYYRLKVFPINIPPLREHPEDIPVLVRHFTRTYAGKMNKQIDKIPSETMRALVSWTWPGNVRELENFIERSVILSPGSTLRAPLAEIRADAPEEPANASLEQVERNYIIRVLGESNGVVSAAATRLGMPRTTLNAMMRKLKISRRDL